MSNNSNHEAFIVYNETQNMFVSIEGNTESKLTERLADAYFWPSQISAESYCEYWKECYCPDDTFSVKRIGIK